MAGTGRAGKPLHWLPGCFVAENNRAMDRRFTFARTRAILARVMERDRRSRSARISMTTSQYTEKAVVLFADICGSTSLYDKLGDELARRLIAAGIATMSDVLPQFQGRIIKTIGDEILCTFPGPEAGLLAACAMQKAVDGTVYEGGQRLQIRVGLHCGSFIIENNDIFGDTVNVAARIAGMARKHQIMTSQAVVAALPDALQRKTTRIMAAELKGKQNEFDIFIVNWDEDDNACTQIQVRSAVRPQETLSVLTLQYGDTRFVVNKERKQAMIGRGSTCDLVIASTLASRQHAGIEFRLGKFFIVDQSSNGTYVRTADGHVEHITRQEMILRGAGLISLGQAFSDDSTELIEYCVAA